ncbi:MAG: (Fe-S)-binding protein [Gemmatimonadetes bacterium]|nr:(Fe-S)-binding protein [Gemmatimonadota bacterium]
MSVRVALFATCLGDQFYAEACADAVRLLRHLGARVDFPAGQTCCGQPAFNAGRRDEAARMARHTVDVLRDAEYVVLPSGSCAGMIRCFYPSLLAGDRPATAVADDGPAQAVGGDRPAGAVAHDGSATAVAERTYELSQFIVRVLGVERLGAGLAGTRAVYHHSCHALRELRVRDEPVTLLRGAGAEVLPWVAAEECCGFGGLFSAKLPEVSAGMADRKLDTLPAADFVTSTDAGCLLQLSGRAARRRGSPRFRHLASVLWQAVGR